VTHRGRTVLARDCALAGAEMQRGRPLNTVVRRQLMDLRNIALVVGIVAVAGLVAFVRVAHAQGGPDAQVITQLKQAGSNISKPHPIEFYIYVPSKEAAERVAVKVRALGCGIKRMDPAASGPGWLVLATKSMVPVEADLSKLRKHFDAIAKAEKGEYDGWETEVIK
jgi:hypothetical protein